MSLSDSFIDPENLYDSYKSEAMEQPRRTRRAAPLNAVGQFQRKKSINST